MTDMEKKVMVRLCAKILSETDLYDTDIGFSYDPGYLCCQGGQGHHL